MLDTSFAAGRETRVEARSASENTRALDLRSGPIKISIVTSGLIPGEAEFWDMVASEAAVLAKEATS